MCVCACVCACVCVCVCVCVCFFFLIVSNHLSSTDLILVQFCNIIPFCCDMYFCFNVICPYLYSHLCVYIL